MGFSIKRKGRNEWYLDVRAFLKDKVLRKRETFKGSKVQAEERFIEIRSELKQKLNQQNGSLTLPVNQLRTFSEMVDLYLEKKGNVSKSHLSKYKRLKQELGEVLLPDVGDRFEVFVSFCRRFPSKRTGKLLSGTSINRFIEIARAVMNLAVELEVILKNPITKGRFPKYKEIPRDVVLSEEQIQRLFQAIECHASYLKYFIQYALQVPARKNEMIQMRRADLDLINNAIRVRNGTTKNDAGCWKPIPPDMVEYFRNIPKESEYLFYRYEKKANIYHPLGDIKKSWNTCRTVAGVPWLRIHDLRHCSATRLIDMGTPERVVQEVAGWKTDQLRNYYHRGGKASLNLVKFAKTVQ